jgi:hypothetical protein
VSGSFGTSSCHLSPLGNRLLSYERPKSVFLNFSATSMLKLRSIDAARLLDYFEDEA